MKEMAVEKNFEQYKKYNINFIHTNHQFRVAVAVLPKYETWGKVCHIIMVWKDGSYQHFAAPEKRCGCGCASYLKDAADVLYDIIRTTYPANNILKSVTGQYISFGEPNKLKEAGFSREEEDRINNFRKYAACYMKLYNFHPQTDDE